MSKSRSQEGLTMVETALLLSVVGVVAAVALPTFIGAVETSKISETSSQLQALYVGAASYYGHRHVLDASHSAFCLPEPAGPTPDKPSREPVAVDFSTSPTWQALRFAPTQPLRYRYTYAVSRPGCELPNAAAPTMITLRAEGDLDGDGVHSSFERSARVLTAGELTPDPVLHIRDRVE